MKSIKNKNKGITLIEVIVSIAIFMLIAPTVAVMALGSVKGINKNEQGLQATALSQEALEASRSIRDYEWDNLTEGTHGLSTTNGYWELSGVSDAIGVFTRATTVTPLNENIKEVSSTVSWGEGESVTLATRVGNWENTLLSWIQTTVADFQAAESLEGVVVVARDDGEVHLADDATEGVITSVGFNTGYANPNYDNISWVTSGAEGTIKFQLRTSNSKDGLHSAVWLGPDGTKDSYYTVPGTTVVVKGGTRWVQYRAFFTGNLGEGLDMEKVIIQYNPYL
ncbi:MAG: type II secretion system protein [Candidatus Peregrinibacteria bacterium]